MYPFALGYIIAKIFKKNIKESSGKIRNYIKEVLKREVTAKVIWIVIKRLNYDINHPQYIEVVRKNYKKGGKYRYIVSKDEYTESDLESYKNLYKLSDNQIKENFLVLQNSDMIKFLRHVTIYDPHTTRTVSYFYPHSESGDEQWYITFNNSKSMEYVSLFKSVWLKNKGILP